MVKLENISKKFIRGTDEIKLFEDFSYSAARGEFSAICGPSGGGKTTLMLIIGSLLFPDRGKVLIEEQDIYSLTADKKASFRAQKMGFVFQQFHLLPYLNIQENIKLPELAQKQEDLSGKAKKLIQTLGLAHREKHFPAEISIGERQRTALARALIHNPDIVLADEPTGNLDQKNTDIVISELKELAKNGKCVIMVTHDKEAAKQADRILDLAGCRT